MPGDERVVYSSIQPTLAHLVAAALANAGVPARLSGEHRAGMGGVIGMHDAAVEVRVPAASQGDALAVLAPLFGAAEQGGELALSDDFDRLAGVLGLSPGRGALTRPEPTHCPQCEAEWEPGFEVCWSCEAPL